MILDTILAEKRLEVEARKAALPLRELKSRLSDAPQPLDFSRKLVRNVAGVPAVIAEVKKASPSKGLIRPDFDPEEIARAYEAGGAAAVSVLTDEKFFQGSLDYLRRVKRTISLPVLRKDFIIDEYQVFEARVAGADAILLIVTALDKDTLAALMNRATEIGLQCLVEVHDEAEMDVALDLCAPLVGINNRDLRTFEVSLDTTERVIAFARERVDASKETCHSEPEAKNLLSKSRSFTTFRMTKGGPKLVSESGIFTRADMDRSGEVGVDAVLIGEALMREKDIESKLRELIG